MPVATTVDDPYLTGWAQPPFDPRINTFPLLQNDGSAISGQLQRGYLKQAQGNAGDTTSAVTSPNGFLTPAKMVNFLYNPSSISVSHTVSTTDASMDPSLRSALDPGDIISATGASLSFSLLFDRTYEVSNPANFGTKLAEQGVAVDINAIYSLVGILNLTDTSSGVPRITQPIPLTNTQKAEAIAQQVIKDDKATNVPGIDTSFVTQSTIASLNAAEGYNKISSDITKKLVAAGLTPSDLPTSQDSFVAPTSPTLTTPGSPFVGPVATQQKFGFMTATAVLAVFGIQRQNWNPCLQYYGYIAGLDIEYAHWTQAMVPVRAAVTINMALLATNVERMTQLATT